MSMQSDFVPRPASEAELSAIARTLVTRPDSDGVRERLAFAAALLAALPQRPDKPCLIHQQEPDAPPGVIEIGQGVEVGRQVPGPGCLPKSGPLSRRHFAVRPQKGGFLLEDLKSRNGTFVDGLKDRVRSRFLRDGDFILAGDKAFLFWNPLDDGF